MTNRPVARSPSQWPDAQRAFAHRLDAGTPVPSTSAVARWWTNDRTWIPRYGGWPALLVAALQGICALLRRQRRGPAGSFVALWYGDTADGDPDLIVPVAGHDLPSADGRGPATVRGEFAPNGALCIEISDQRILPIYNPQRPWGDLAKRARSTPAA